MNVAAILAGGSGQRMRLDIPKQFLTVNDKPVVIYTLEAFEKHPDIESILVICLDGWQESLRSYAKQAHIKKLKWIVAGGSTGQESARNGIAELKKHLKGDDIVIMHDANRPLVSQESISDAIVQCKIHGSAVAAIPCTEPLFYRDAEGGSNSGIPRDELVRTQTPHAFPMKSMVWAHEEAQKRGITNSVAIGTLMLELGQTVHLSHGSEQNFKITTMDDLELFRAILQIRHTEGLLL